MFVKTEVSKVDRGGGKTLYALILKGESTDVVLTSYDEHAINQIVMAINFGKFKFVVFEDDEDDWNDDGTEWDEKNK